MDEPTLKHDWRAEPIWPSDPVSDLVINCRTCRARGYADDLNAQTDAQRARIAVLEAALKPLAALWHDDMESWDDDLRVLFNAPFTVGDVRRARKLLGDA